MDGKTQAWRDAADKLIEALAKENKYIVADMMIIFLESAGYGLPDYSPLGGVFKRAAKRGIISKIDRPTKQALWHSMVYQKDESFYDMQKTLARLGMIVKQYGLVNILRSYKEAQKQGWHSVNIPVRPDLLLPIEPFEEFGKNA